MRYRVMGMMSKCSSALYTGSKIYPQEHRKRDQAAWMWIPCSMFSLLHVSESRILSILRCLSSAKYDHLVCTTMVPPRKKPSPFGSFSGKTKLLWFRSHSTATLQTLYCHSTATLQPLYRHSTATLLPLYSHSTATLQPRSFSRRFLLLPKIGSLVKRTSIWISRGNKRKKIVEQLILNSSKSHTKL